VYTQYNWLDKWLYYVDTHAVTEQLVNWVYWFTIQLVIKWDGHWVGWVNHIYFIQSNRKVLLYAVQSFVQPVIHTVKQPAVASYMQTVFCWTSQLYNWLYHVNGVLGIDILRSIHEGVW